MKLLSALRSISPLFIVAKTTQSAILPHVNDHFLHQNDLKDDLPQQQGSVPTNPSGGSITTNILSDVIVQHVRENFAPFVSSASKSVLRELGNFDLLNLLLSNVKLSIPDQGVATNIKCYGITIGDFAVSYELVDNTELQYYIQATDYGIDCSLDFL